MTLHKVIQKAAAGLGKGTQYVRESNEFIDRKVASSNTLLIRSNKMQQYAGI